MKFIHLNNGVYPIDSIVVVSLNRIEELRVDIVWDNGCNSVVTGMEAVRVVMQLCPQALEGRRLRWVRHAWALHNLIGHPLMQVFAFLRMHRAAMWVHDATIPKPRGAK